MCNRVQIEVEVWRLIILRRNASEFLVFETDSGLFLPRVEIPAHTRLAQTLNDQVKALWGLEVYSLYPLPANTPAPGSPIARYHVIEALQHEAAAPPAAQWIPIRVPMEGRFIESEDFAAVQTWIKNLANRSSTGLSAFDRPGWFLILKDWVQKTLRPFQMTLTGDFVQFNASATFSLIRFATDGDAVWFKAVGEPNTREFPLTIALSELFPGYTPRLLATEPRWNAWLAEEVPGVRLAECDDTAAWKNAARDLAALQIASVQMTDHILECESRDMRSDALLARVVPFFAMLRELMKGQTNPLPTRLLPEDLAQLESDTRNALSDLRQEGVPNSLGHLDLNPGNIIVCAGRTVFLDWAEASVGHPFFSFAHLLEHFRRNFQAGPDGPACLIREYTEVWKSRGYCNNPEKSICLAIFLAIFVHAVSTDPWRDPRQLLQPRVAGYYRSLARRMKSYASRIRFGATRPSEVWA